MKTGLHLCFVLWFIFSTYSLSAQQLQWAKNMGSTGADEGLAMVTDAVGNVYTTGYFSGTVDFDPNAGVSNLTALGNSRDIFIQKLDPNGDLLWARKIGGIGQDEGRGIALDGSGNVYLTGTFQRAVDFDPGAAVNVLFAPIGAFDSFLLKLDANGNFVWVKSAGLNANQFLTGAIPWTNIYANAVAVDNAGNAYIVGDYQYDALQSVFVIKFDNAGNGVWARWTPTDGICRGLDIALDNAGEVYITGNFTSKITFDAVVSFTSNGNSDIFLAKVSKDFSLNVLWAKAIGSTGEDTGKGIEIDGSGNIYLTGTIENSVDFGSGVVLNSAGKKDAYVIVFDNGGNPFLGKTIGGAENEEGLALKILGSNLYLTGTFQSSMTIGTRTLISAGAEDIFLSKIDNNGSIQWGRQMGGAKGEQANDLVLNSTGDIYLTGGFGSSPVDLDPSPLLASVNSAGVKDIFVNKINEMPDQNSRVERPFVQPPAQSLSLGARDIEVFRFILRDLATTDELPTKVSQIQIQQGIGNTVTDWTNKIIGAQLLVGNTAVSASFTVSTNNLTFSIPLNSLTIPNGGMTTISLKINVAKTGLNNGDKFAFQITTAGHGFMASASQSSTFAMGFPALIASNLFQVDTSLPTPPSQDTQLEWAKRMGGTNADGGVSTVADIQGNVYTTGTFQGTADFDPGAGVFNLISAGNNDIFVQKLDANGNLVWAKNMGGTEDDEVVSIEVDDSGNVYLTGYFQGTADFDPGAGVNNLTSAGGIDIFVQKLDTNGNLLWAKSMGGTDIAFTNSIAVDDSGNVYLTGSFKGTIDFDPGVGVSNLTALGIFSDIFVQKLDTNGNFVWAISMKGTSQDGGMSIVVDGSGSVYITGFFGGTVDFDPGAGVSSLTSAGNYDIFVQKLDTNGNLIWAKSMGGISQDGGKSITVDSSGNVYLTGYFIGTVDFDPGVGVSNLTAIGNEDIFVQKLDANGNLLWVKSIGGIGIGQNIANSITLDGSRDVYVTGSFEGAVDFDPGAGVSNLTSAGNADIFVQKLDKDGNFIWVKSMGGTGIDGGSAIILDGSGYVYLTGFFNSTVDFDPSTCTNTLSSSGSFDVYTLKMSQMSYTSVGTDQDALAGVPLSQVPTQNLVTGQAGVPVFNFRLVDTGSLDCTPASTIVRKVSILQGTGNTVTNWVGKIIDAQLFIGNTPIPTTLTVNTNNLTFAIAGSDLVIPDNSEQTLTLQVSLAASGFVSGDKLAFSIANTNLYNTPAMHIDSDPSGSRFASVFPNTILSSVFPIAIGNNTDSRVVAPAAQVPAQEVSIGLSGVSAFRFVMEDIGSSDGLSTNVRQVVIRQGAGNTVGDWSGKITDAKLLVGGSIVSATPTITANAITFALTGSALEIANASKQEATLLISLAGTGLSDGDQLAFQIPATGHGFTVDAASSQFAPTFPALIAPNVMTLRKLQDQNSIAVAPVTQVPAQTLTMGTNNLEVFKFTLQDLGSRDGLPTLVKQIYIQQGNGNTVADWSTGMSNAQLFLGNTPLAATVSISAGGMTFTGLNVSIPNSSSQELTLKINLASTGFANGEKLSFQIPSISHNLLAAPTGSSQFAPTFAVKVLSKVFTIGIDLVVTSQETHQGNYNKVTIKATGELTLSGNMSSADTFKIEAGGKLLVGNCFIVTGAGSFVMEDNTTLQICSSDGITLTGATGTVQVTGTRTYAGDATYFYKGSAAQVTGNGLPSTILNLMLDNGSGLTLTNNVNVKRLVELLTGDLTSNAKLTLLSTANLTGMIVQKLDGSNQVVGNATIQRHLTGGQAVYPAAYTGVGGYHYFSSPLQNGTVAEFADNMSLVLNPAYDWVVPYGGAFPNFYRYREDRVQATAPNDIFEKGWESPANTSENLEVQKGYIANVSVGTVIDFVGLLNNGNLNINLSRGTSTQAGWHLVGNPYPAPISWTAVVLQNANIQGQVLRRIPTGQYAGTWASYVNGVGQNGATDEIALAQGFFVRANVNNAGFQMNNAVRLQSYFNPTFFRTEESESAKKTGLVKVGVRQGNLMDETAVYFEDGASEGFDFRFDAERAQFNSGGIPSLYSFSKEGKRLAINGLPDFKEDYQIPLTLYTSSTGKHQFTLNEVRYFRQNVQIYVEDKLKNTFHNLRQEEVYNFEVASAGFIQNRFVLHFTNKSKEGYESLSVFPNPSEGETNLSLFSDYQGDVTINVYDLMGKLRKTYQTTKQERAAIFRVDLSGVEQGLYLIEVVEGSSRKSKKWKKG